MSWQDKALAAFWADAFANKPLDSHRRIEAAIAAAAASLLPSTDAPMADHPITPPPKLFKQWEYDILSERDNVDHVLDCAWRDGFRAGADQELEACCEWLSVPCPSYGRELRLARRPKPPSLKEQALETLRSMQIEPCWINGVNTNAELMSKYDILRRALEALDG